MVAARAKSLPAVMSVINIATPARACAARKSVHSITSVPAKVSLHINAGDIVLLVRGRTYSNPETSVSTKKGAASNPSP